MKIQEQLDSSDCNQLHFNVGLTTMDNTIARQCRGNFTQCIYRDIRGILALIHHGQVFNRVNIHRYYGLHVYNVVSNMPSTHVAE